MALAAVVASGCATSTRLPSETHTKAVLSGQAAIVLLRLLGEVDGKPVGPQQFHFRLANLDEAPARGAILPLLVPSETAAQRGWAYLELGPGSYFLELPMFNVCVYRLGSPSLYCNPSQLQGPTGRFVRIHRGEFIPTPAFRLDVRAGEHVVYAGTLSLSMTTQRAKRGETSSEYKVQVIDDSPLAQRAREISSEYKVQVIDDSAAARDFFGQSFAPLGLSAFVTRLAQAYDEMLPEQAIRALSPIGLATASAEQIERFSLRGRAMGMWLTPAGVLVGGGVAAGYPFAMVLIPLGVAYTPIGALGGLISGELAERQKRPCIEALGEEFRELRLQQQLAARILEGFAGRLVDVPIQVEWGPTSTRPEGQEGLRSLLFANITRVQLQEAKLGFYVEVAMRVRLWEIARARWAYDRSFVYGLAERQLAWSPPRASSRPYEVPVLDAATPRKLDAYCATEGRVLFRDDVRQAIEVMTKRLVEELGLTEPLSGR